MRFDGEPESPPDLIKIDVDPGHVMLSLPHMRNLLDRAGYRLVRRWRERSGSGKGWHVYVRIDPPTSGPMELVALQAVLGSDRYREACNVHRVRTLDRLSPEMRAFWGDRWNVCYRRIGA